jgi:TetR/AcrR family fatty acid metabolism transcriptional regulator
LPESKPLVRCKSPHQADKILAAAARLFTTHRFHEARMEDIAALAEVGKGTLYRYFKDKDELYLALLARAAEDYQARLREAIRPGSPREQLVAVVDQVLRYFEEQPHVLDLIQHAEVMQKPGEEFPWQKTRNETMALVRDLIHNGQHEGAFVIEDVSLAMLMLLGGLRAVLRFGVHPIPAGTAERIVDGFLNGYGAAGRAAGKDRRSSSASPPAQARGMLVIDGASSSLHNA